MIRELSVTIEFNDKYGSLEKPSDWRFVPPDGEYRLFGTEALAAIDEGFDAACKALHDTG